MKFEGLQEVDDAGGVTVLGCGVKGSTTVRVTSLCVSV